MAIITITITMAIITITITITTTIIIITITMTIITITHSHVVWDLSRAHGYKPSYYHSSPSAFGLDFQVTLVIFKVNWGLGINEVMVLILQMRVREVCVL